MYGQIKKNLEFSYKSSASKMDEHWFHLHRKDKCHTEVCAHCLTELQSKLHLCNYFLENTVRKEKKSSYCEDLCCENPV